MKRILLLFLVYFIATGTQILSQDYKKSLGFGIATPEFDKSSNVLNNFEIIWGGKSYDVDIHDFSRSDKIGYGIFYQRKVISLSRFSFAVVVDFSKSNYSFKIEDEGTNSDFIHDMSLKNRAWSIMVFSSYEVNDWLEAYIGLGAGKDYIKFNEALSVEEYNALNYTIEKKTKTNILRSNLGLKFFPKNRINLFADINYLGGTKTKVERGGCYLQVFDGDISSAMYYPPVEFEFDLNALFTRIGMSLSF